MGMLFVFITVILVGVSACFSANSFRIEKPKPSPTPFQDWNYIVYSQRWPVTACSDWKERNRNNTCNMPPDPKTWVIHGVWPTKIGAKGPFYCNSAMHFDPDQLQPLMRDLDDHWPNLEANTKANSFWKHEWAKHGTCASSLPVLNSVTNYFQQGLDWNRQYKIDDILDKGAVVPNLDGYNISVVYGTVKSVLGKRPTVQCVVDSKTKQSLLSEIRLCFNKDLELIDCNTPDSLGFADDDDDLLTNCNLHKHIMYFAEANRTANSLEYELDTLQAAQVETCLDHFYFRDTLLKFYSVIKFFMWFTL